MNNFDILVGQRGCGVSTWIAKEAVENDGVIIVPTSVTKKEMVNKVIEVENELGVDSDVEVFTIYEFTDRRGRKTDKPVYVDNFDVCFAELLAAHNTGNKVVCYGTTMEGFGYEQL